jgi:hypothetical protein
MHNITFDHPENLPASMLVIIIAVLVIFFNIFVRLNITDYSNLIYYYYYLSQVVNNRMTEICNSIANSESYCLHHFNAMMRLQEAAGLQSKDRIMISLSGYQIPGKITNNLLSVNRVLYHKPIIYDDSHVPQLDSNPINTSKYNQGSIDLKTWTNKVSKLDNFSTYTNYDYAFTLRYPSNWSFEEINKFISNHDLLVVKFFPNANSTHRNSVNVSIFVDESVINRNLNGYINERLEKYKKSSVFDSISRSTESSYLSVHPAYKLLLSESGSNNRRLNSIEIGTVIGGKGFIIRSTANDDQYSLHEKDIELIMNSFRLLGHPL